MQRRSYVTINENLTGVDYDTSPEMEAHGTRQKFGLRLIKR
jgi:hypothetical protein